MLETKPVSQSQCQLSNIWCVKFNTEGESLMTLIENYLMLMVMNIFITKFSILSIASKKSQSKALEEPEKNSLIKSQLTNMENYKSTKSISPLYQEQITQKYLVYMETLT